ncbi:metallophosphoesterase [Methanothermobacter wolfeii]|uniref:Phosphoesterase n=1 Tax=Methanothermobacter wolfeii TaxID=145261 RepID=A0ABU8TSP0_METWO|nr:metallophosphoesterase [Methanothermobacter wolfeii]QHN06988.1 metallophosphoesterase [Methanothermobacter sp. THM-1]
MISLLGIISDSHDNLEAIRKAVEFLNTESVDLVIHAGDLISPFTAPEFRKLEMKFEAIFGNNDGERDGLREAYSDITDLSDFKSLQFDGLRIAVIHGHSRDVLECVVDCGRYDLVVCGHTHRPEISDSGALTVNPGELCGYLSGKRTLALLDTDRLSCEIIEL